MASIAEDGLSASTQAKVRQLLAGKADSLADIANWADKVRPWRPATVDWHFVDIPADSEGYDPQRDCQQNNCVVAQITLHAKVLSNKSATASKRFAALKWVVHLVGDVHQPLHCINNDDRGGNDVKVKFDGRTKKLHQVWDSGIINDAAGDHGDYSARLFNAITPAQKADWLSTSDPAKWATECFLKAKLDVYEPLKLIGHPGAHTQAIPLRDDYADNEIALVETQLQEAGVRLAALLESSLK